MKSYSLILTLLFMSIISFAQNSFSDIIYPIQGKDSISNCHILKIRKWNHIIYEQHNNQDTVEAIAAVINGRFIDFRTHKEKKNNTYPISYPITTTKEIVKDAEYYESLYKKAVGQKYAGLTLTLLGTGCIIVGLNVIMNQSSTLTPNKFGSILLIGGTVAFNLGFPYLIIGSSKAHNNKQAMLQHQKTDISLNIGTTNTGIGFLIKF